MLQVSGTKNPGYSGIGQAGMETWQALAGVVEPARKKHTGDWVYLLGKGRWQRAPIWIPDRGTDLEELVPGKASSWVPLTVTVRTLHPIIRRVLPLTRSTGGG